ncbi:MAG: Swt1 family HEPN domain-containing protein [Gallionella sp.]|nr:Swt1 family HEPN domain-containing protein [Gallionella sp.]
MDVTQALHDAENSLRDFIALVLSQNKNDWIGSCGVAPDRIARWEERKSSEAKRQESGAVEERLIYYADFYDLKTILKKNWPGAFSEALGDWKTFEVYFSELEKLRDTDAHRRELMPHQKHLILGVSGEIRNRIVRYRSKMETLDGYFPRIESARDSLGNIWVPGNKNGGNVITESILRPGDILDFVITASDPEGLPVEYSVGLSSTASYKWQANHNLQFSIADKHISRIFVIQLSIRSNRPYHASSQYDDSVSFFYKVLPCAKVASTG